MNRARQFLPSSPEGLSMTLGLVLLAIGLALVYLPLAFIVPGAALVVLPLLPSHEAEQ